MVVKTLTDERPIGSSTGQSVNKGTLFCGECQHRSHFDGDWTIVETDDRTHYICPDCRSEILTRRVSSRSVATDETCVSMDTNKR